MTTYFDAVPRFPSIHIRSEISRMNDYFVAAINESLADLSNVRFDTTRAWWVPWGDL